MALLEPFIERFYRDVDRNLGDPHTSVRYPKSDRLNDLHDADTEIFDQLLKVTGQDSMMGYSEKTITVKNGVSFYQLPIGFRHFIQMERRDSDGRVLSILRSKGFYQEDYGIEILSAHQGFRFPTPPQISADSDWVFIYLRSPGFLHYAKASEVGDQSLTTGIPGTDAGELILIEGYYNGMDLRVYKSGNRAAPQQINILDFKLIGNDKGVFLLRYPWNPKPEGDVWYELCPTLPLKYDGIYALDAALSVLPTRSMPAKAQSLLRERRKKWMGAQQYFSANVADRPPSRTLPLKASDLLPTEVPYY